MVYFPELARPPSLWLHERTKTFTEQKGSNNACPWCGSRKFYLLFFVLLNEMVMNFSGPVVMFTCSNKNINSSVLSEGCLTFILYAFMLVHDDVL